MKSAEDNVILNPYDEENVGSERMDEKRTLEERELISGGFLFCSKKDAELAETERKKIAYLEERMDYSNPEKIWQIYEKAVQERIFITPTGLSYLKKVQDYLMEQPEIPKDSLSPIPLLHTYDRELREKQNPARNRLRIPKPKKKKQAAFPISVILNILLLITVIVMFAITLDSDNPNVLNYERALTDRYASWEQELTEREQTLRERERALEIEEQ